MGLVEIGRFEFQNFDKQSLLAFAVIFGPIVLGLILVLSTTILSGFTKSAKRTRGHSNRKAWMGSTVAARRAGIAAASKATTVTMETQAT